MAPDRAFRDIRRAGRDCHRKRASLHQARDSLERQTATTEVLETINGSPGDLQPVFETILAKAMTLCDAAFGTFYDLDGQRLHTVATRGVPEAFARYRLSNPPAYGPGTGPAGLIAGEDYVHVIDAADSEAYRQSEPQPASHRRLGRRPHHSQCCSAQGRCDARLHVDLPPGSGPFSENQSLCCRASPPRPSSRWRMRACSASCAHRWSSRPRPATC